MTMASLFGKGTSHITDLQSSKTNSQSAKQFHGDLRLTEPAPAAKYAFTEFMTFEFSQHAAIEEITTKEGKIWAQTVKTFIEQEKTGLVWWGRTVEQAETVRLLIDWHDSDAYYQFQQSPVLHELQSLWRPLVIKPVESCCYVLPSQSVFRENALSQFFGKTIATVLTFHFPQDFNKEMTTTVVGAAVTQEQAWEYYWREFWTHALRGQNSVTNSAAGGWSLAPDQSSADHISYCGILRWKDVSSSRNYLQQAEKLPWIQGGLERLRELASTRIDVQHIDFTCFKNGWSGSTTGAESDVWHPNNPFGSTRFGSQSSGETESLQAQK